MVNWRRGGCVGSIRRLVRKEVRAQLRTNGTYRRVRYSFWHRLFRRFFYIEQYSRYIMLYFMVDVLFVAAEALGSRYLPKTFLDFSFSSSAPLLFNNSLLVNVSGYFIAAQVGVLGIIALALALVSLIAQRENSATDIRVYYHESLAFQIVASSLALLAILVVQLVWPLQMLIHYFGLGHESLAFEYFLQGVHLIWLTINLAAIAYFIATTFRFVQQSTRELLRERYTANVIFPHDLTQRLHETFYTNASNDIGNLGRQSSTGQPTATFGFDYGVPSIAEVTLTRKGSRVLWDIRMNWVGWVVRRWFERCRQAQEDTMSEPLLSAHLGPQLWFTPKFKFPIVDSIDLCKRRGGVPLTTFERLVLRHSFRFRRWHDGS